MGYRALASLVDIETNSTDDIPDYPFIDPTSIVLLVLHVRKSDLGRESL
jgi:hypothetical protein